MISSEASASVPSLSFPEGELLAHYAVKPGEIQKVGKGWQEMEGDETQPKALSAAYEWGGGAGDRWPGVCG